MATIRSQLQLTDSMTSVLRRINSALLVCLDSFESMQSASGHSIDTSAIDAARSSLIGVNAELNAIADGQNRVNNALGQGAGAADNLLGKLKGIVGAYVGIQGAKKAFELSDTLVSTTARLEMVIDNKKSTDSIEEMESKIFASAERSRGSYQTTADAVSKFGLMAGDAFSSTNEIIAFSEQLNKSFVVAGTEASGIDSAMLQLTQAMGSGVLRGEEFNSILEQAPNIIQSIADYMDVPKGALKDMAAEGKITADIVKKALLNPEAIKKLNSQFESMPKTFAQTWQSFQNQALMAFQPVLNRLNEILNSEKIQQFVSNAITLLTNLANAVLFAFDLIAGIGNFIAENWSVIAPIIGVVGAAVAAYTVITLAFNAAQAIATAAQNLFNSALWSCPVTWIIAAILVLVAVFLLFTENLMATLFWWGAVFKNIGLGIANFGIATWAVIKNVGLWFANLGLSIWTVIKNVGMWFANLGQAVWAIIQNVGAWFGNLGMGIWEVLKACASNVATAFKNGWIDIQIGFWAMVNVIMQGVKKVAEFANTCLGWMGVNIDTSGLDFAANKIDELNKNRESYKDIGEAWEAGSHTFEYKDVGEAMNTFSYEDPGKAFNTFEYDDVGEAFNTLKYDDLNAASAAGYQVGSDIKSWMGNALGGITEGLGANGFGDDIYGDVLGSIADNTGSTAASLKDTTEDLKYLRDSAEREAVNRFTTAEVKIDMTGMTNRIDSAMDLDGLLSTLTEGFAEALETTAEGVHA